jgi:hypothetical protein
MAEILHQRDHHDEQHSLPDPQDMQAHSKSDGGEDSDSCELQCEGEAAEFTAIEQSEEAEMGYCLLDCHGAESGSFEFGFAEHEDSESEGSAADTDEATSHDAVAMRLLQSMEADYTAVLRASSSHVLPSSATEQPAAEQLAAELQLDDNTDDNYDDDNDESGSEQPSSTASAAAAKAAAATVQPMSAAKVQRIKLLMSKMDLTAAIAPAAPSWAVDLKWQNGDVDTVLSCLVASATIQQKAAAAAAPPKQHRK